MHHLEISDKRTKNLQIASDNNPQEKKIQKAIQRNKALKTRMKKIKGIFTEQFKLKFCKTRTMKSSLYMSSVTNLI